MAEAAAAAAQQEEEEGGGGGGDQSSSSTASSQDGRPKLRRWLTVPLLSEERSIRNNQFTGRLVLDTINIRVRQDDDDCISNINNYTSLRDLLHDDQSSPGLQSPTSCYDIPIRNMLLKQAAYAYLQPKTSPQPKKDRSWFGSILSAEDEDELEHHSSDSNDGCKSFVCYIFNKLCRCDK